MQLAIIHNDGAGQGLYSTRELVDLFERAGHSVAAAADDVQQLLAKLHLVERPVGAIVVSGGDGTVAKVAITLSGGDTPLFVLPSGTSNNIAASIGASGPILPLINGLATAVPSTLDVSCVRGAAPHEHFTRYFVEGAGFGFIGSMLSEEHRPLLQLWRAMRDRIAAPGDRWARAAHGVARLIREQPTRNVRLVADGVDLSGEYVAVQALNIRAIGPRVQLAPNADPADRRLDLLLVKPSDRDTLADYIEAQRPPEHAPPLDTRRVRHVRMDWPADHAHVDDGVWPPPGVAERPRAVEIDVAGEVKLLVPR